MRKPNWRTLS